MPITHFHLGPGLLLKAVWPPAMSLTAFGAANVGIDAEVVIHVLLGNGPVHGMLHTPLMAGAVGLLAGAAVVGARWAVRRIDPSWDRPSWRPGPALAGGLLGAASQVLLDALMHADVRLLAPFAEGNPLLGTVDLGILHTACAVAGLVGAAGLLLRRVGQGE